MPAASSQTQQHTELQRALEACRTSLIMVFGFSCGYNLLLLTPSIYLLQIYNRVLASGSVDTLVMLTAIVAAAVVVDCLLDTLRRAALSRIGFWLEDRLHPTVFAAAFTYTLRHDSGGLAAEVGRDLATLRQFIGSSTAILLFDLPWAPLFLAALFLAHPLLGVIGVVGLLLQLCLALIGELLTRGPLDRSASAEARVYRRFEAALRNARAIRAMGMLDGVARLVYRDLAEARDAQGTAIRRGEMLYAVSKPIRALTQVFMMGAAAWLVVQFHVNAAVIFASSLLLARGLAPIDGVISGWKAVGSARHAYRSLTQVLAVAPHARRAAMPLPRPNGVLSVENVRFAPPNSNTLLLEDISLRLNPGECLGVVGPSGAGKSTLGRMIAGVAAPTLGHIRLDGADISVWLDGGGAKYLGYLPQEIELFDGSVKDNIARFKNVDPEQVIEAAKLVGLHETILRLPEAYDTEIGENGIRLSGGQCQCLGLARAFYGDPRLVVLDEPNASLDRVAEEMLYDAIDQLKAAGVIIIIITHRMGILATTDKIALMRAGSLFAFGDSDEIYDRYLSQREITSSVAPNAPASADRAPETETEGSVEPAPPRAAALQVTGGPGAQQP